jgi:hypothetical protein
MSSCHAFDKVTIKHIATPIVNLLMRMFGISTSSIHRSSYRKQFVEKSTRSCLEIGWRVCPTYQGSASIEKRGIVED